MLNLKYRKRGSNFSVHFMPVGVDEVILDLIDTASGFLVEHSNVQCSTVPKTPLDPMAIASVVSTARSKPVFLAHVTAEEAAVCLAPIEGLSIPLVQVDDPAIVPRVTVVSAAYPSDFHAICVAGLKPPVHALDFTP
jgi:hypothetical protein